MMFRFAKFAIVLAVLSGATAQSAGNKTACGRDLSMEEALREAKDNAYKQEKATSPMATIEVQNITAISNPTYSAIDVCIVYIPVRKVQ